MKIMKTHQTLTVNETKKNEQKKKMKKKQNNNKAEGLSKH